MRRSSGLTIGALLWALGGSVAAADTVAPASVTVDLAVAPSSSGERLREGAPMRVELSLHAGGDPLATARPALWLVRRGGALSDEQSCRRRAEVLLRGGFSERAAVDLNQFRLLTEHTDGTLAFVNPQAAFARSRVEAAVQLGGRPAGWHRTPDGRHLWVALPEQSQLVSVELQMRKVVRTLNLAAGTRPEAVLVVAERGRLLALGDGAADLLDAASGGEIARFALGRGAVQAVDAGRGVVALLADGLARVTLIDVGKGEVRGTVPVAGDHAAMGFDPASGLVWVAAAGELLGVDPAAGRIEARLPAEEPIGRLDVLPGGQHLLLTARDGKAVSVLDTARRAASPWREVSGPIEGVAFGPTLAYLPSHSSGRLVVLDLARLRAGEVVPVTATMGTPEAPPAQGGPFVVPRPDVNGAVIADPASGALLFYTDGLMAVDGEVRGYSRGVRGVELLDEGLAASGIGRWSATATTPAPGAYDAVVVIDSPRLVRCFGVALDPDPTASPRATRPTLTLEPPRAPPTPRADVPVITRVMGANGTPIDGLRDVQVVAVELPGIWRGERVAHGLGGGRYETTLNFPHAGVFQLSVAVPSRGVGHGDGAHARLVLRDTEPAL